MAALVQVLRDREEHTEEALVALHENANADAIWDVLAPVIDRLGDGEFDVNLDE